MDDLSRAVAQFYPTWGGGGFSQPPTPTPPPENFGLGLIPGAQSEVDRPDSFHYPSASSQEAQREGQPGSSHLAPHQGEVGKEKLLSVLERHVQKHFLCQKTQKKYPCLLEWGKDLTPEDLRYYAEHIAMSELDIEGKEDFELADLADHLKEYRRSKSILDQFLDEFLKTDDF
jgi:hypothetical protein